MKKTFRPYPRLLIQGRAGGVSPRGLLPFLILVALLGVACSPAGAPAASNPASAASAAVPSASSSYKLAIGYPGQGYGTWPIWLAADAHIFEQNGLQVELKRLGTGPNMMAALLSGQIQIAAGSATSTINASVNGGNLALLAVCSGHLLASVFTWDSQIQSLSDLKGQTVGLTTKGDNDETAMGLALKHAGLTLADTKTVYLNTTSAVYAGLISHRVEAAVLFSPLDTKARVAGLKELFNFGNSPIALDTCALSAKRSTITNQASMLLQTTKAYVDAIAYLKSHKKAAERVLRKYLGVKDQRVLDESYSEEAKALPRKPYITDAGLQPVIDGAAKVNPKLAGHKASEFFDNRFVKELDKSGYIDNLYK